MQALETAMTDSHPPVSGPPPKVRTPRPPKPELPVMAPASDEPTEPGAPAPTVGPLDHNLVAEDSLLEPYRLVEESTLVEESSLRGVSLDEDVS